MKKYVLYIIGYADDEDRTEYVADAIVCSTREEAIAEKRKCFGEDGIWSGCDVYAKISEIDA